MNDNEEKNVVTKYLKQIGKVALTKALPVAVIIVVIVVVLGALTYVVDTDLFSFKEGDWSNVPYASSQYTSANLAIDDYGNITTGMTAQELWDKMIENGSDVDKLLDSPADLKKLMNAEVITQYPDTRENPDEEIDWDKISSDVNSNSVQGIIKFTRADANGNKTRMTYVSSTEFQELISAYEQSGSDKDKEKMLSSYTIVPAGQNPLEGVLFIGDSFTSKLANTGLVPEAMYATKDTRAAKYWLNNIKKLPEDSEEISAVCVMLGLNNLNDTDSMEKLIDELVTRYAGKTIYVQKLFPTCGRYKGLNTNITKYNETIESYCNGKSNVKFIDATEGYVNSDGSAIEEMFEDGKHIKVSEYEQYIKNLKGQVAGSGVLCWPSNETTDVSSGFGYRGLITDSNGNYVSGNKMHNGIDIPAPYGTSVYAVDSGVVTFAGDGGNAGNEVIIDHGNGLVTEYMHNSQLLVNAGQQVTKGQEIAKVGSTGASTGAHIHLGTKLDGEYIDPLSLSYENGIGGTTTTNSNGETSGYCIKVAYLTTVIDKVYAESGPEDPDVEYYDNSTTIVGTKKVDYQELVSRYTMPFYYLWDFVVLGGNGNFALSLADLVNDSEIDITIYDNETSNIEIVTDTYTKWSKTRETISYSAEYSSPSGINSYNSSKTYNDGNGKETTYVTKHYSETRTNTLFAKITTANVWIVNYTQQDAYSAPTQTTSSAETTSLPNVVNDDVKNSKDYFGKKDTAIKEIISEFESKASEDEKLTGRYGCTITTTYSSGTKSRNTTVENSTVIQKYMSLIANLEEKTDKNSKEPNFVTLFNKHEKTKDNILSADEWLYEALESNSKTADMVDLTKYLFYKATGDNYGVTEFDFSIFAPEDFTSLQGNSSIDLLREFIHYYEGVIVGESGYYKVYRDSNSYLTVGYGVCVDERINPNINRNLKAMGYSVVEGEQMKAEDIDAIENDFIMGFRSEVISKTEGLNLTAYQINALTSRAYQCGTYGALSACYGQSMNFVNSYNAYWNEETDDYYEDRNPNANYNHSLYTNFMSYPKGYANRRQGEWTLFQTGYYAPLGKWHPGAADFQNAHFVIEADGGLVYPQYKQSDYKNVVYAKGSGFSRTIAQSGCGPSSLAMILAGLLQDASITPETVVNNVHDYYPNVSSYYAYGYGSQAGLYATSFLNKYYGISKSIDVRGYDREYVLSNYLDKGYPIIGGETGHVLAIIPYHKNENGKSYRFYILDSSRGHDGPCQTLAEADRVVRDNYLYLQWVIIP